MEAASVGGLIILECAAGAMSAIGPKQTCIVAPHTSAIEGKADMPF